MSGQAKCAGKRRQGVGIVVNDEQVGQIPLYARGLGKMKEGPLWSGPSAHETTFRTGRAVQEDVPLAL